jgi:hypothetical protein
MKDPAVEYEYVPHDLGEWVPPDQRIRFILKQEFTQFQTSYLHGKIKRLDYDLRPSAEFGRVLCFWFTLTEKEIDLITLLLSDRLIEIQHPEDSTGA